MTRTPRRFNFFATSMAVAFAGALALSATALLAHGENAEHVKQLKETGSCPSCDLTDADLVMVQAEKADLRQADARHANLYGANLRGANLTGAKFNLAFLLHADLSDAIGADLTGAVTDVNTICPDKTAGPCK
jgi:uncharacterized protein YjbI with pentapeptide repeats